ncbi:MAG: hypothetical protein LUD27_01160 [Clostridia bacterium]|nr:hypothetical protein [Clostridia bacterium]
MKKVLIFTALLFTVTACTLCSCGIGYAKVSGIQMYVTKDGSYLCGTGYTAETALNLGEEYILTISYSQSGGSKATALTAESITLEYDGAALRLVEGDRDYDPQYTLYGLSPGDTEITVTDGIYSAALCLSFE